MAVTRRSVIVAVTATELSTAEVIATEVPAAEIAAVKIAAAALGDAREAGDCARGIDLARRAGSRIGGL
jgi:hypothetical protein